MADTRDQAVEQAVNDWAQLTEAHPISEIALISDASNKEIDRLNARAQHYRVQRGELGDLEAEIPGVHYGIRKGDRIALIERHHERGKQRIENGSRGQILDITPAGEALIEFDLTGQRRTLAGEDLARLRLAYAQHIHRAQGATVTRTLVVTGGWLCGYQHNQPYVARPVMLSGRAAGRGFPSARGMLRGKCST
jgi:ATP-dependent exoDNAse (exonuclease V) alpha subunit